MKNEGHLSEEVINMYLDGELSAGERERVEAHLATCEACQVEVAAQRRLFTALTALAPVPAPDLVPDVLSRIRRRRRLPSLSLPRPRTPWLVPALQTVIALALLVWSGPRLLDDWHAFVGFFPLKMPPSFWGDLLNQAVAPWAGFSAWALTQWATLRAWPITALTEARGETAHLLAQLSPVQWAILGGTLLLLWGASNVVLLHRPLFNGQMIRRH